jgi:hypothetical protein
MSCARDAEITPPEPEAEPELPPMEVVLQKIKQNSPEIEKYFLFDKAGELTVKAELNEIRQGTGKIESFQVLYDLGRIEAESSGAYLVPFTVKCMDTGMVQDDTLLWKPQKDDTGILLSLDDHYYDVWERNFDLFDRYNAHVTFFVQGTYNSFCTAALKRGHDVGYHTLRHLNLTKVSRQVFFMETISQVENFRNSGAPLVSFAYPFGLYEPWMHEELLKTYKVLRDFNVSFYVYDQISIRGGFVFSRSIDNFIFEEDDVFFTTVDSMFRTIKFIGQGLILPLTSHSISNADWGIKPHRLEYILKTAGDLQLNFYRYGDFFREELFGGEMKQ